MVTSTPTLSPGRTVTRSGATVTFGIPLIVADPGQTFLISGAGDVIEPDEGIAAIGSGGSYALSAARALMNNTQLPARTIAEEAMKIAGQICIFTNDRITYEELAGLSQPVAVGQDGAPT